MSIIFFGTPEFAVPSLKALIKAGEDIPLVVTQPDRAKGRGHKVLPAPLKITAKEMGIQVIEPLTLKDDDLILRLSEILPEFIIVVAYGKILPRRILDIPLRGCINLHASLLPKYRGAAPIQWALINGEETTGVTTMLMDEGLDTGPVFLKQELGINEDDNAESLSRKLSEIGASLLIETVRGIRNGSLKPRPQEGEPSFAPPLKKEDGDINWNKTAREIFNLIRGTYPWPGAHCFIGGERVRIIKARPLNSEGRPGIIEKVTKDELLIGTGKGLLSILELQPSGRSQMNIRAFLQGRRLIQGSAL
ncbi:MAG: methionyl-tRNA formyltransferase [Thermodesulfovibrionales bacterium]